MPVVTSWRTVNWENVPMVCKLLAQSWLWRRFVCAYLERLEPTLTVLEHRRNLLLKLFNLVHTIQFQQSYSVRSIDPT
jgi:hypothetical protein